MVYVTSSLVRSDGYWVYSRQHRNAFKFYQIADRFSRYHLSAIITEPRHFQARNPLVIHHRTRRLSNRNSNFLLSLFSLICISADPFFLIAPEYFADVLKMATSRNLRVWAWNLILRILTILLEFGIAPYPCGFCARTMCGYKLSYIHEFFSYMFDWTLRHNQFFSMFGLSPFSRSCQYATWRPELGLCTLSSATSYAFSDPPR
jgi:hypothetical protein